LSRHNIIYTNNTPSIYISLACYKTRIWCIPIVLSRWKSIFFPLQNYARYVSTVVLRSTKIIITSSNSTYYMYIVYYNAMRYSRLDLEINDRRVPGPIYLHKLPFIMDSYFSIVNRTHPLGITQLDTKRYL